MEVKIKMARARVVKFTGGFPFKVRGIVKKPIVVRFVDKQGNLIKVKGIRIKRINKTRK